MVKSAVNGTFDALPYSPLVVEVETGAGPRYSARLPKRRRIVERGVVMVDCGIVCRRPIRLVQTPVGHQAGRDIARRLLCACCDERCDGRRNQNRPP